MTDQEILDQFNADFEYMTDAENHGEVEHWRIPTEPNGTTVRDDCDGYATGLLFRLVDRNEDAFWAALEDGTAKIVKCRIIENGQSHAALNWKGNYVDNVFPYFREPLKHEYIRTYSVTDIRAKISGNKLVQKLDSKWKRLAVIVGMAGLIFILFNQGG